MFGHIFWRRLKHKTNFNFLKFWQIHFWLQQAIFPVVGNSTWSRYVLGAKAHNWSLSCRHKGIIFKVPWATAYNLAQLYGHIYSKDFMMCLGPHCHILLHPHMPWATEQNYFRMKLETDTYWISHVSLCSWLSILMQVTMYPHADGHVHLAVFPTVDYFSMCTWPCTQVHLAIPRWPVISPSALCDEIDSTCTMSTCPILKWSPIHLVFPLD